MTSIHKTKGPIGSRDPAQKDVRQANGAAMTPMELALKERMKELNCLQQIEKMIGTHEGTFDELFQKIVNVIPEAWVHSTDAVARIRWGESAYSTGDVESCKSLQSSSISANGNTFGMVEVGYTRDLAASVEGPFLAEEQLLLDTIALRLGSLIARALAEARLRTTLQEQHQLYKQLLSVLGGMAEMRDPYTAGHQKRVAQLAVAIGKELGLSAHQLEGVQLAGSLHDIGKIMVPAEILCKPTKLTRQEYELIKEHAQAGYHILKDIQLPWPVARIVLEHHERMDGSGYPNEISGDRLLLESRIVAVADVVESMCAHRPYRAGLGTEAALAEITSNRNVLYDPVVVDACLRLFHEKGYTCGERPQD
jgi:putative nucleotidyltransferase with HDIG domain